VIAVLSLAVPAFASALTPTADQGAVSDRIEKSATVTRVHDKNGAELVVDRRTVTVSVDTTTGLRDRQAIDVSWTGAHPTGGIVADQNSGAAASQQEYPVVLLQCRGVDTKSVPPAQRVRPETCWTQTPYERFSNEFSEILPPWRMDQFALSAERKQYVNLPKKRPPSCFGAAQAERWLPFVTPKGKRYPGGPNGCAGVAPEATSLGGLNLPGNTTYASTAKNGRGSAKFSVRASSSNASLGCSDKVRCSLVVIPIMGISCDSAALGLPVSERPVGQDLVAAAEGCEAEGRYAPGDNASPGTLASPAVSGTFWWSASNWRNRITVPLKFAPLASACDIARSGSVSIFGSELMIQATEQWAPIFCLDRSRTVVRHVQTGEPQARNLLKTGGVEAALVSNAPDGEGYTRPVVSAPVAMSGFAITYAIDGENGRPYTDSTPGSWPNF
jgi:hypothetical protein